MDHGGWEAARRVLCWSLDSSARPVAQQCVHVVFADGRIADGVLDADRGRAPDRRAGAKSASCLPGRAFCRKAVDCTPGGSGVEIRGGLVCDPPRRGQLLQARGFTFGSARYADSKSAAIRFSTAIRSCSGKGERLSRHRGQPFSRLRASAFPLRRRKGACEMFHRPRTAGQGGAGTDVFVGNRRVARRTDAPRISELCGAGTCAPLSTLSCITTRGTTLAMENATTKWPRWM